MKLSTRVRYGVRALVSIAFLSRGRPVPLGEVARRENISKKYLELIIASLKKADLVESRRGAMGGYILKKSVDKITLKEIVNALGGPIRIVDCLKDTYECSNKKECALYEIWADVNAVIEEKLDNILLKDIVEKKKKNIKSNKNTENIYPI